MDFTKGLLVVTYILDVHKGTHEDESSGVAKGVRKYKGTRSLRMTVEHFRTLKAVSQVLQSFVRLFIRYSRHMKILYSSLILPSSSTSPLSRPTVSLGTYARSLCMTFRMLFSRPRRLRDSLPLLNSKQV
jgi:hypothetical protein